MTLVIVHHHLRPGGIRRVIELAAPHLVAAAQHGAGRRAQESAPNLRVVLATGQRADRGWHEHFARQLRGVPVEVHVKTAFNYLSEQRRPPEAVGASIRRALAELFARTGGDCLVWAHNLGVGRNLLLARELAAACAARNIPLVSHHHDWWFDNRWARWPEMRRAGFRTLAKAARAVFPPVGPVLHAAINHADAALLRHRLGRGAVWLPNLSEPGPPPAAARVRFARRWLGSKLAHPGAPVWLLPCRTLRRKNIAEALLLTRWLRPEAWLVVTGAASSADEAPYFRALERAAHRHHWRLRLGVLAGDETRRPGIPELLAASEAVLLTSMQEGFGLPYLEAAAAQRPLIARRLPNIAPDLDRFGFRFPQAYDEILIPPTLFDWHAERVRQGRLFRAWRATLPGLARVRLAKPPLLGAPRPRAVPFSRLTLTAQLAVLARPVRVSWAACLPLNPFLATWRRRAATGTLRVTPWPHAAKRWLAGEAYARRFFDAVDRWLHPHQVGRALPCAPFEMRACGAHGSARPTSKFSSGDLQADFIAAKLDARNLYPLLWSQHP